MCIYIYVIYNAVEFEYLVKVYQIENCNEIAGINTIEQLKQLGEGIQ